jgi:hypothetical protein
LELLQVAFTPLDPPSVALEPGPFQPRGYFRRAATFWGRFAGYCFKLDDRGLGYYRDPSQGPAWHEQLDTGGRSEPRSPLQLQRLDADGTPKPYYQQSPGHKTPASLRPSSPRATSARGSENTNPLNSTQFNEFAITQHLNRATGSFAKGTHEYLPLPEDEDEAYRALVQSACRAFERTTMGVVQFYNLVNKLKRFFVTPDEIAAGLRQLTSLDLHPSDPAVRRLLRVLDPAETFEISLPMLKKHW